MNIMDKKAQARFSGVWCPSITPFDQNNKLDFTALEKHFQRLDDSGIDGIMLMGSVGEFATMSMNERLLLIQQARLMSKLPMIAHVSATCFDDMVCLADAAYDAGYDAVMALPHFYYAQSRNQIISYYRALDSKFSGDWLIYNFPACTGCDINADIVVELATSLPKLAGMKDMVDCATHTQAIVYALSGIRPCFSVFTGYDEYIVSNLMNGGAGVISALSNVVPELFAQILKAYRQGDLATVAEVYKDICRMTMVYSVGDDFVTTIKTAVMNKYHYLQPLSRNFGGKLTDQQSEFVTTLFK